MKHIAIRAGHTCHSSAYGARSANSAYFVSLQRQKQREKASNFRFCQFAASKQHDFLFVSPESRGVVVTVQRSCQLFRPFDSVFTASRSWRQLRGVGEQRFTVSRSWRASTSTSMQVDAAPISVFCLFISSYQRIFSHFFPIFCPFFHFFSVNQREMPIFSITRSNTLTKKNPRILKSSRTMSG